MHRFLVVLLSPIIVLLSFDRAWTHPPSDEGLAACASCGGLLFTFLAILTLVNIAILVWVARDAKARGMSSPVAWLILIFFTGLIGLIIFILSRPSGRLEPCPHCGNKRLAAMVKCPHCGNSSASPASG